MVAGTSYSDRGPARSRLPLVLVDNHIGSYGRECAIRPNKLYLIEEKGVIASISAFAVSNSLHGKCPRTAGTGTFTLR
jgi:hypothetical protein